jgi:formate dehydrogenase subunit delta
MSNKIETLIRMANDISDFFNAEPDKEIAAKGVINHIKRSWDPRMRSDIIAYLHADGSELSELARNALSKLN